jgi:uncharacterized protein
VTRLRRLALCAAVALLAPVRAEAGHSGFIREYLKRYRPAAQAAPSSEQSKRLKTVAEAALAQTQQSVQYDPAYVKLAYPGGDVAPNKGVCTDVVIRAYRKAKIDLQVDVHEDMAKNFSSYPKLWGRRDPDKNIDHRRVPNLMVYFERNGASLPISTNAADYAPGDLVAWDLGNGVTHIGVVVDGGRIVHNIGRGPELEDVLLSWKIIGHFRYLGKAD